VSKAGFSAHYIGALACKDKWQTLFADYKKISDYKGATGNREDYCASHFQEMEKFLSKGPASIPLNKSTHSWMKMMTSNLQKT
jgi:hypothetical protein